MIPTPDQERELKRCFSAVRHAYNSTVTAVHSGERPNFYELRKAYANGATRPAWAEGVASKFVVGGVEAAVNAFQTNLAKRKKNPSHTFTVKHISHRKTPTEVIRVEGDGTLKQKNSSLLAFLPVPFANNPSLRSECLAFFGSNLKGVGGIRMQDKPRVIDRLLAEGRRLKETCRIQWDKRTNSFHFLYVYDLPALPDPDPGFETKRLVATDPGERTFQTWYSPTSGGYGALFEGGRAEIERRCVRIDDLASKLAKRANAEKLARSGVLPSRTKEQRRRTFRSMRRKLAKERKKVHDWMECGHYSCANFLLSKFDVVIAPHLPVAGLVPRNGRVFGSKAARSMLTWSHGLFCSRLKSASFRWAGRHVLTETGEPGTSKTCARCGHWHSELGAKEVFACPRCGVRMERDVAGARNNFFAAFGKAIGIGWDGLQH